MDLEADVALAVARRCEERGVATSEVVHELIRLGLMHRPPSSPFVLTTFRLGLRVDVANVAEALDLVEGSGSPQASGLLF